MPGSLDCTKWDILYSGAVDPHHFFGIALPPNPAKISAACTGGTMKYLLRIAALAVALWQPAWPVAAAQFEDGLSAHNCEGYTAAVQWLPRSALALRE